MMKQGNKLFKKEKKFIFFVFLLILLFALALLVMLLWNAILPTVLSVSTLSYWQAFGLLILCRILFGSYRFGRRPNGRPPFGNPAFREKFKNMTEEERIAFRQKIKERCAK